MQDDFKIVATPELNELESFAVWFHQDWRLTFPDFLTGAELYMRSLSATRRTRLERELNEFVAIHAHETSDKILEAWFALGAGAWQVDLDLIETLNRFSQMTNVESSE